MDSTDCAVQCARRFVLDRSHLVSTFVCVRSVGPKDQIARSLVNDDEEKGNPFAGAFSSVEPWVR